MLSSRAPPRERHPHEHLVGAIDFIDESQASPGVAPVASFFQTSLQVSPFVVLTAIALMSFACTCALNAASICSAVMTFAPSILKITSPGAPAFAGSIPAGVHRLHVRQAVRDLRQRFAVSAGLKVHDPFPRILRLLFFSGSLPLFGT